MRTGRPSNTAFVVGLLLACACVAPAAAQVLREEVWVPDREVHDMAIADDTVYLGGDFTQVGPPIGALVGLDAITGSTIQPFPRVGGIVNALVTDGAGGWYLGGSFVSVRGAQRANLAHVDAAGIVTGWNPGADSEVLALTRDAVTGVVYAGGSFLNLGGAARAHIAAVDSNGAATSWNPGTSGAVTALALSDGTLYAGGSFVQAGGTTRRHAAAFDAATGALSAWNPDADDIVYALAVHVAIGFPNVTTVYLGGAFDYLGAVPRFGLAAVDGSTGAPTPWNPGATGIVNAIVTAGGSNPVSNPLRIYVGGTFGQVGTELRNRIAQLNEGGVVTSWNPDANDEVLTLLTAGNLVYAGGRFTAVGGQPARFVAAIDRTTGSPSSWDPRMGGAVRTLAAVGGTVFAGGEFFTAGGVLRRNLAALHVSTGLPTTWNPAPDAPVLALATDGATLWVGGSFSQLAGQARNRLAAVDVSNGALTGWNPDASGAVSVLTPGNGVVYVAGAFTTIGGQSRAGLAAINLASGLATAWNPGTPGTVLALEVDNGWVYAGGLFTTIGGQIRHSIARLDTATGLAAPWNPNPDVTTSVYAIAASGPHVFIGGFFDGLGGRPRSNLAVVDTVTGLANTWDPYADFGVGALATDGSTIYVGGGFNKLGGAPRRGLGALDAATGLLLPWEPGFAAHTLRLKLDQGALYAAPAPVDRFWSPNGSFAVFSNATTAVSYPVVDRGATHLSASPNPFHAEVALRITLPRRAELGVTIHDLAGRVVRRLELGVREAGERRLTWDGRDQTGRRLGAGVYFAHATTGALHFTTKMLKLD